METYRLKEVVVILNINADAVHSYIRKALPDRMKPKKTMQEGLGRETYEFTEKNVKKLKKAIRLKATGLTYKRVKEELALDNVSAPVHEDQIIKTTETTEESREAMNELILKGITEVDGMRFNHIEGGFGDDKKAMLVRDIADIHNQQFGEINRRINDNIKRFKGGVDILDLKANGFEPLGSDLGFTKQGFNQTKNIYLLSERGYSKLLKILEDDFAWEQYEKLVDGYFSMREKQAPLAELSPQLQLLINMELKQTEMETAITQTNTRIDGLKDVIALDTRGWRTDTKDLIVKMAHTLGGHEHIKDLRNESYDLLDARMGVNLSIRLTNKRRRMADEGVSVSKRNKLNYLDVIAEDKKLIEGYVAIVKEMAIKYDVA